MNDLDPRADGLGRPAAWSPIERSSEHHDPDIAAVPSDPFSCLSEVDLFTDLSAAEMAAMDQMAPAELFQRGQMLYNQTQPIRSLFIVKTGRVRVFRVAEDGKALTLAILEPGAVFGDMLLVGQRMYDSYAEAIDDALVCRLSTVDVEQFLLADARIAVRIARILGERVAELEDRLTDLALRPLASRVAVTLLNLTRSPSTGTGRFSRAPQVQLTHEQVAGVIGATREATSRVLSDFAERGLIRQGRGRILITDPAGLRLLGRETA
ncbi:MAG: Crp/Fnr family transcriptional regulator [Brachybacterium sp.]|nr:Crp/Fnr family transcriptional regulator [Brachybacterium sp.]MDN5900017.1 Crp/Fnr family transcriptional regulator [Brachybacterium sp.]